MSTISITAPTVVSDIIYHSATEQQLIDDIATGKREFPCTGKNCILLYGDYGTGKTTLARLLPETIEQSKGGRDVGYDFIACSHALTGPALMQQIYKRTYLMSGNISSFHYTVLDEVDLLSSKAQASLKTMMGIPHTIFIMTTNYIGKIDAGVQTRSLRVNCNAAPAAAYLPFARNALTNFGGHLIDDDKLLPIIAHCKGCVRDIAEHMQRIALRQRTLSAIAA